MRRREVVAGLATTMAWPFAARAQQPKVPTVGFLVAGAPSSHGQLVAALVQRLGELGCIEGRTVLIDYRWAEGSPERAAAISAEFAGVQSCDRYVGHPLNACGPAGDVDDPNRCF